MVDILRHEPAFPNNTGSGMSLRQWYAGQAIPAAMMALESLRARGMLEVEIARYYPRGTHISAAQVVSAIAFDIADEMAKKSMK